MVYQDAVKLFSSDMTSDLNKIAFVNSSACLQDIQNAMKGALESYQGRPARRATVVWLSKAASHIQFYGRVFDVMAQHHPEYLALGWGAVKFFLMAVINHEDVNTALATGLLEIGELLPRVELASTLYPTARMKSAITTLYAYLLKFFIRARNWYNEGSWKRIVHSITRPSELRYKDLLQHISRASNEIDQLSRSASQAEIRTVHDKMDALQRNMDLIKNDLTLTKSGILDLQAPVASLQAICSSGFLNTNQQLTDLQFSQIMQSISQEVALWDPLKTFRYLSSLRRRRPDLSASVATNQFWNSPKLRKWSNSAESSVLVVKGNPQSRFALRDFCVDVTSSLNTTKTPYLLALRVPAGGKQGENISTVELLKYLTRQALQLRGSESSSKTAALPTEKSMALSCAQFHSAVSEREWFQLLEAVMEDITGTVYVIIELEIVHRNFGGDPDAGFSLFAAFAEFFMGLERRGLKSRVKVLLVTSSPESPLYAAEELSPEVVLPVKAMPVSVRRRAGRGGGQGRGNRGMWLGRVPG
ncbi:hypothetical protein B0T16DRAFT_248703 [Cercophora newfieldiana]|uniref:DUF7708 domain-containing protein n=1 Tax=Cercophora newfieldiana TaxID=92897 RepID=A0AA40CIM2_9PEZI|nr:hypothetical protein B0T16DRAFT_248703 [Cercophora newfieldiana]